MNRSREHVRDARAQSSVHADIIDSVSEHLLPELAVNVADYAIQQVKIPDELIDVQVTDNDVELIRGSAEGIMIGNQRVGEWVLRYSDGQLSSIMYYDYNGQLHRNDAPAIIKFKHTDEGLKVTKKWYNHGILVNTTEEVV